MKAIHNQADGVLEEVLAGADLRIFLQPDDTVIGRSGTHSYIETLDLSHIIINGGDFWGCQRNLVVHSHSKPQNLLKSYYSYYSGLDIFSNNVDHKTYETTVKCTCGSQIMSTGRYKTLRWHTVPTYEKVFDSDSPENVSDFVEAITDCRKFKAAIFHNEGHIQIHPIIYPFYYKDLNLVDVQTEVQFFPIFMRGTKDELVKTVFGSPSRVPDFRDEKGREINIKGEIPTFSSYFQIFGDGRAKRPYDLGTDNTVQLKKVMIFASRN